MKEFGCKLIKEKRETVNKKAFTLRILVMRPIKNGCVKIAGPGVTALPF
jgi:hypothetical protein